MLYIRPDYFHKFKCTADKCQDTCCAGWQIMIDDASIEKYKKIKSDYILFEERPKNEYNHMGIALDTKSGTRYIETFFHQSKKLIVVK